MLAMAPVILERRCEAFFDADLRLPTGGGIEFSRRTVDAADIDGFFVGWKRNDAIRAAAGGFQQDLYELFERDRPNPGQIEVVAFHATVHSGDHKRVDDVIDVVEASKLLPITEYLDFFAVESLLDKPSDEPLP